MDDLGRKALLFDFYGPLLTQRQQEVYDYSRSEDMSLGEIAEALGISRQAVHDNLRRTEKILEEYEAKLGLAETFLAIDGHVKNIRRSVSAMADTAETRSVLQEIDAIDALERR
ncbi:MAG: YlxM family DNA-binding protein [Bacillota bacterium]|nr:YlxM family DNA-binding protein [Bacillota bacterium]